MSILERRGNVKQFLKDYPVSSFLIIINIIVHIIKIIGDTTMSYSLLELGAVGGYYSGEYERFLYAMFLHDDLMHLLFNTFFGLVILGATLERLIGSIRFTIVYFVAGLASSLGIYTLSIHPAIGASGAIYGVLGVLLFIVLFKKTLIPSQDGRLIIQLIIVNVIITFVLSDFLHISNEGHFSGLIAGFILAPLLMIKESTTDHY